MEVFRDFLTGIPKPKGSWVPVRKKDGTTGFRPASNETAKWCASAKRQLKELWGDRPLLNEPVAVDLLFLIPRRKTVIRPYPTSRMDGDGDKLDRGVWDALTDTILYDDSLVVDWIGSKRYISKEEDAGVYVTVSTIEEPPNAGKILAAAATAQPPYFHAVDTACPGNCSGDTGTEAP